MKAKGCTVGLSSNRPGFTLPSNIGELGDDIVKLDLSQCSLQGITCRVAPTLRDGTQSEIFDTASSEMRSRAQGCCRSRSSA